MYRRLGQFHGKPACEVWTNTAAACTLFTDHTAAPDRATRVPTCTTRGYHEKREGKGTQTSTTRRLLSAGNHV